MKIAIVGSRDYPNEALVRAFVHTLPEGTEVVSGGARGVDRIAEQEARVCGLETLVFPAEWERYGKSAGYRRNHDIIMNADIVVTFWDGLSKGTAHSIDIAHSAGKPVLIVKHDRTLAWVTDHFGALMRYAKRASTGGAKAGQTGEGKPPTSSGSRKVCREARRGRPRRPADHLVGPHVP